MKAVLVGPVARGGQRLVSVECYDGGLALRGESAVELPAGLRDSSELEVDRHFQGNELDPDVEVTDDVGTSYLGRGAGASSDVEAGRYISKWTTTFVRFRVRQLPARRTSRRSTAMGFFERLSA